MCNFESCYSEFWRRYCNCNITILTIPVWCTVWVLQAKWLETMWLPKLHVRMITKPAVLFFIPTSALFIASTRLFVSCRNNDIPTSLAQVVIKTDSFCLWLPTELNPRANLLHLFSKISISKSFTMEAPALFQGLCRDEEEKLSLLGFLNRNHGGLLNFSSRQRGDLKTKWLKCLWNTGKSISTIVLNTCMVQYPRGHRPNFRLEPRGGEWARQFIDCLLWNLSDSHTSNMENRLQC